MSQNFKPGSYYRELGAVTLGGVGRTPVEGLDTPMQPKESRIAGAQSDLTELLSLVVQMAGVIEKRLTPVLGPPRNLAEPVGPAVAGGAGIGVSSAVAESTYAHMAQVHQIRLILEAIDSRLEI